MGKHTRVCYHTHLKVLEREGLLCKSVVQNIPRSNLYRWRAEPWGKYADFGLAMKATEDYELLKSFAHHRSDKRIYAAFVRVISAVLKIAHSAAGFKESDKSQQLKLVDLVTP